MNRNNLLAKSFISFLTIALLILVSSCKTPESKTIETEGILIVANKSDNTVNFIHRGNGDILATVETGLEPHEVEVSPDGKYAVVTNYGNREFPGNTLTVINISEARPDKTIDLGEHTRPHGMVFIDNDYKMLVTTEGSNHILLVDIEHGDILKAIPTEQEISHMVAYISKPPRAFVPSIRTGNLTVIDMETGEIITHAYSGQGAEGVATTPDEKEVWVTNRGDNTITVFDTQTLEIIETLPCGDFPIRAKFSPDGSYFLVSNARSGDIKVFHAEEKTLAANISLKIELSDDPEGRYFAAEFQGSSIPIGLVVPDNKNAYIANTNADVVTVIDLEDFEIIGHFKTGKQPDGIAFSPLIPEIKPEE